MSLDLSEAVEAARLANDGNLRLLLLTPSLTLDQFQRAEPEVALDMARTAVAAAAPLIEAQVRAQVAAEIRARIAAEPLLMYVTDWRDGMETAAEIAGVTP